MSLYQIHISSNIGFQNHFSLLGIVCSIFMLSATLFIAGCASPQKPMPTEQIETIIPTTIILIPPGTSTPSSIPSRDLGLQSNFTVTITGTVREVVPSDNLIIIAREKAAGNQAIAIEPDSILIDIDDNTFTITEINRGMLIQATGRAQEEDFLIAQRVLILETPPETVETPAPQASPAPPTPITLSDVSSEWVLYDFPDLGISLSMPADWEMSRMPGAYFFGPMTITGKIYRTQFTVDGQENVPTELPEMGEALIEELQHLTPFSFYTTPIVVNDREGLAFWNLSPVTCVKVYVPAHDFVHNITFFSTFCNETGDQLNEVGQRILESIEFYPPTN